MYERIVVALDGSDLAERILPHVVALGEKFGSTVTLVRATASPVEAVGGTAGADALGAAAIDPTPIVEADREEAGAYLAALVQRLASDFREVDSQHAEGPAGEVIVERAGALGADLIAMTTHGRGGLGRLVLGSVADEVVRRAPCPVLLVRVRDEDSDSD